jgi:hypothetical protein
MFRGTLNLHVSCEQNSLVHLLDYRVANHSTGKPVSNQWLDFTVKITRETIKVRERAFHFLRCSNHFS